MIIDGVTLDHEMYWENEYQWAFLAGTADRCIDGSLVVQVRPHYSGRSISLVGDQNSGWQKKSTVDFLRASYALIGHTFTFSYNSVDHTVRWAVEEEDACSFQPIVLTKEPEDTFWYYGTVKLITV